MLTDLLERLSDRQLRWIVAHFHLEAGICWLLEDLEDCDAAA